MTPTKGRAAHAGSPIDYSRGCWICSIQFRKLSLRKNLLYNRRRSACDRTVELHSSESGLQLGMQDQAPELHCIAVCRSSQMVGVCAFPDHQHSNLNQLSDTGYVQPWVANPVTSSLLHDGVPVLQVVGFE
jgi:hypothetical protein